ncbi:hypothetical protein [Clostridium sp.]|uniref:hypothetical protein n=1 Tax=Clostridium sp. TaxID=1506 RepID=UPI003992F3A4
MFSMELIVQENNECEIEEILRDSMGKDDKVLTAISGEEGKGFKAILDKFKIKNSAICTIERKMIEVEKLEKELMEDDEITHFAAVINGKVDNLPLMRLAKKYDKILINIEQ